ncbi:zincin-like metallopeptidase domain-containing protein [Hyphomicrobium sp. CS1BSMeth3]|uniref:zincin-like metallopeptidase domain-containing protein n=1 Tax=Hyphomicrobium sp. CS1BSMeth3 TaxID=1892844 RepID=UPI0024528477|nr:zincin-like metallopeptidase domain-containing protein [Hyphomicrobium sp. CS1BSMeth3]
MSAYTMAYLGLSAQPRDDHARYIANWLKALKDDERAIFTAAARAPMARTASPLTTTSSTPSTPQDILRNR